MLKAAMLYIYILCFFTWVSLGFSISGVLYGFEWIWDFSAICQLLVTKSFPWSDYTHMHGKVRFAVKLTDAFKIVLIIMV